MNVHILASNVLGCGQEHKGERACREDGAGRRVKAQPDEFDYLQVCVIMHRCFSAPCAHEHTHAVTRRTPSMQKTRHTRLKNKHTCFENLPTQNLPRIGVCGRCAYVCLDSYGAKHLGRPLASDPVLLLFSGLRLLHYRPHV